MPPKKKKKVVQPPRPPGRLQQYLTENFSCLPDADFLNGHVLFMFVEHNRSYPETSGAVNERFGPESIQPNQLRQLVRRTILKYKQLARESDMNRLDAVCREKFEVRLQQEEPSLPENEPTALSLIGDTGAQIPSTSVGVAKEGHDEPSQSSSNPPSGKRLRSHGDPVTPRKARLRKRLDFVSQTKRDMKKKYLERMKEMRKNIRKPDRIKHLNQIIRRKQAKIAKLQAYHSGGSLEREIADTKKKLNLLKRKHQRMKKRQRQPVAASSSKEGEKIAQFLQAKLKTKEAQLTVLEDENLELRDTIESLTAGGSSTSASLQKEGQKFSKDMRMLVYDAVENHVPTKNVPIILAKFARRCGIQMPSVPHRTTVELMCRELGVISDFQVGEILKGEENLTMGFDATTQEGVHVNAIHVTSKDKCYVVSLDQLPGGTAEDYETHIVDSIDRVAEVYSDFLQCDFVSSQEEMINNISNTMTDRVAVNHATIVRLEETWRKPLNELNCHLHPLETLASSSRAALKAREPTSVKAKLFGHDCIAANTVLAINKFRFKDGKGDPKGFVNFLDGAGFTRGILPRYRGNRLHVLFHICGKLFHHHAAFSEFFLNGTVSCGGLQSAIHHDFNLTAAKVELQVLGLIGKLLSGPWMTLFYSSASTEKVSHVEGIARVKNLVDEVKEDIKNPSVMLTTSMDFFGNKLEGDETLAALRTVPADQELFDIMMEGCLAAIVTVLERQYHRYFNIDVTEQLKKEAQSARCHNIDAEEVMGMFSAAKEHAPNATLGYLSSRIRAQKNGVVAYLDSMEEGKRDKLIDFSVATARTQRQTRRKRSREIQIDISQRIATRKAKKDMASRKKIERTLKNPSLDIANEYPNLDESIQAHVRNILDGKVVGHRICHIWYDKTSNEKTVYHGKIEKLKKNKTGTYVIGYWSEDDTYDNATDYDISKYALAADLVCGDVSLS